VSGLDAKPIIDIAVGVQSLEASRPCIDLLGQLQYLDAPYRADVMHWFCKPDPARRTHHLHLIPTGSPRLTEELAFRDYLRDHPDQAAAYALLKKRLAAKHSHDREADTAAKTDFIAALTTLAQTRGPDPNPSPATAGVEGGTGTLIGFRNGFQVFHLGHAHRSSGQVVDG
jgi:GrpB-like predicted nucleotidyltransferase (UPF0157 family)